MKYNKILFLSCSLLLLAGSLTSCADLWKEKTNNEWEEKYVWTVSDIAMGVLYRAYTPMPSQPDSYGGNFLDAATDNAITRSYGTATHQLTSGNYSATSDPLSNWGTCYNCFQYINTFLENGLTEKTRYDKVDPVQDAAFKKRLYGEAHFLRAWWGFELLRHYGGKSVDGTALGYPISIHFITEEEAAKMSNFARNTYQECAEQIMKDCDVAIENLPAKFTGTDAVLGDVNIGMPTALAAAALKSRVALYAASPAYQDDSVTKIVDMGKFNIVNATAYEANWKEAALIADQLIKNADFGTNVYGLKATDLADAANTTPTEFLFRKFANDRGRENRHFPPYYWGSAQTVPSQNLVDAFPMANGYPIDNPASGYDNNNPYVGRDQRFYLNIYYHGAIFGNTGQPINVMAGGKDSYTYNNLASLSGYYLAKHISKNEKMLTPTAMTNAQHYFPLLRRTEVFLNFAEAANEAWGPKGNPEGCQYTAYDVIKMLREVSGGITNTEYLDAVATQGKDAFRELIRNERRIELAFENDRYYDLRRCLLVLNEPARGVEVKLENGKLVYDTNRVIAERKFDGIQYYYAPMPYDECIKNPDMKNNLGWN